MLALLLSVSLDAMENPAEEVFKQINRIRDDAGLGLLVYEPEAAFSAASHADDLFRRGVLSHRSLDGRRVLERYRDAGGTALKAGENLGSGASAADIVQGWMDSSSHRENMLNEQWKTGAAAFRALENNRLLLVMVFTNARWTNIILLPSASSTAMQVSADYLFSGPQALSSARVMLSSEPYSASAFRTLESGRIRLDFMIDRPTAWENNGSAPLLFYTLEAGKWQNTGVVFLPAP